ncbi:hypothetical protein Leryth_019701 [Lithospermum erythrorhizon]|nr:hypothetical protein Leryth_019701 [Lithospermum erythrorhizon]
MLFLAKRNIQVSMAKTLLILAIAAIFLLAFGESVSGLPNTTFSGAHTGSQRTVGKGKWKLLLNNTGVVAMHMVLTRHDTVVLFDSTGIPGRSGYRLKHRRNETRCHSTSHSVDPSCFAHSIEYSILRNKIRPLILEGETRHSSGSILNSGTIIQVGGINDGNQTIRVFKPCDHGHCDWRERRKRLANGRSYSSSLSLPDNDRIIIVGGSMEFSYEFTPKKSSKDKSISLPFLDMTFNSHPHSSNLYPFLHLSSDGNIFIFSNRDSILFDYISHKVVKHFPRMPGEGSRTFPSSGSSVILPLDHSDGFKKVEVMICGGAATDAMGINTCRDLKGLRSCGRMVITGTKHKWNMDNMPKPRLMNDMVLLPTGDVLIINGAQRGCAGLHHNATSPSLEPYLYHPRRGRFSVLRATKIARMYQSSAVLVPDGRVLVAGGNQNHGYIFKNVKYPTELRLQAFQPPYLDAKFDHLRPQNVSIHSNRTKGVRYGQLFSVHFRLQGEPTNVTFTVYSPPFTTHSVSMNQRMLKLKCIEMVRSIDGVVNAILQSPPKAVVAPAGYYMLSVVNGGIPSVSQWVRFVHNA